MGIPSDYRGPSGKILPAPQVSAGEVVEKLRSIFAKGDEVLLSYLFGSYACGEEKTCSDLDLAVLFEQGIGGNALLDAYRGLYLAVREALSTERFDLVVLNDASLSLQFAVVSHGKLIYARSEEVLNAFEANVIRKYQDAAYLREVQNWYLKERVRRWYSKGRA